MNRVIISQRITSILGELSRLTSTLYAMNMADIQKYPENYEVLSTDAALRAEQIACRLRHLIYSTTSTKKTEYLSSASTLLGIDIRYENGILEIPACCPKRCSTSPASSYSILCTMLSASMRNTTTFHDTTTVLSAFHIFTAAIFRTGGCGTMTTWSSSVF